MGESQADGEVGPRRPIHPVAAMRAVADIPAEGLRAAGEILERRLRREPGGPGPRSAPHARSADVSAVASFATIAVLVHA
jgi:hypothetical protein